MVGEPVPDKNSLMETNIIPDNNEPGLWSVLFSCIMKCIQKYDDVLGFVGTYFCMMVQIP